MVVFFAHVFFAHAGKANLEKPGIGKPTSNAEAMPKRILLHRR
jgi:hypothetical protein